MVHAKHCTRCWDYKSSSPQHTQTQTHTLFIGKQLGDNKELRKKIYLQKRDESLFDSVFPVLLNMVQKCHHTYLDNML